MIDEVAFYMFADKVRIRVLMDGSMDINMESSGSSGGWTTDGCVTIPADRIDDLLEAIAIVRKGAK